MILIWSRMQEGTRLAIDYDTFTKHLDSGDIAAIRLIQNAEVPTGQVLLDLKSGVTVYMYTSDISAIEKELDSKYPAYTLEDVKREGWFTAYVLPSLIIVVLMIVFFRRSWRSSISQNLLQLNISKWTTILLSTEAPSYDYER